MRRERCGARSAIPSTPSSDSAPARSPVAHVDIAGTGTLGAGNADELRRAAHTLKSTSASFGALELSSLCREAEARSRENETTTLEPLLGRIDEEFARVRKALETLPGSEVREPSEPPPRSAR